MASRAKKKLLRRVSQPDSRRHHYVPAGYIGFFAEPRGRNGKLHVWDKEHSKGWISTPNKVAWVEDLYRLGAGEPPHAVEDALAKAESAMIRAIREIDAIPLRQPTVSQAEAIISFVSLQLVRGPELLAEFDRFTNQVGRHLLATITSTPEIYESQVREMLAADPTSKREDCPTYEDARKTFRDENLQLGPNSNYVVRSVIGSQDGAFRIIAGMKLSFYWVGDGEELVTATVPSCSWRLRVPLRPCLWESARPMRS